MKLCFRLNLLHPSSSSLPLSSLLLNSLPLSSNNRTLQVQVLVVTQVNNNNLQVAMTTRSPMMTIRACSEELRLGDLKELLLSDKPSDAVMY